MQNIPSTLTFLGKWIQAEEGKSMNTIMMASGS